jgi:hypothetical protein
MKIHAKTRKFSLCIMAISITPLCKKQFKKYTCAIWIYMMWALFNTIACDWLAQPITTVSWKRKIMYCDAIYYVRRLWFNKNHEFDWQTSSSTTPSPPPSPPPPNLSFSLSFPLLISVNSDNSTLSPKGIGSSICLFVSNCWAGTRVNRLLHLIVQLRETHGYSRVLVQHAMRDFSCITASAVGIDSSSQLRSPREGRRWIAHLSFHHSTNHNLPSLSST